MCWWGRSSRSQGPEDVDASAGEGEYCLGVAFTLGSFAVVEASGLWAGLDADQGGGVEDALQWSAVALWAVQVSADAAGVAGDGCDAGEAGELVRGAEPVHGGGGGDELGAEHDADAGHAGNHICRGMAAKPVLDELVDVLDLLVEGNHPLGELGHEKSGHRLGGKGGLLGFGRGDGLGRQRGGVADLAGPQPAGQGVNAGLAQHGGCLETRQEDQRALVGQVESSFQSRADRQHLVMEPIDRPGAVGGQVAAAGHQQAQFDDQIVVAVEDGQVPTHPVLIGDDQGVLRVGFACSPVSLGGAVDDDARDVDHLLAVVEQEGQQQNGLAAVQVDCPPHPVRELTDVGDHLQQRRFVVGDSAREHAFPVAVDHRHVVMFPADVESGPQVRQRMPFAAVPSDTPADNPAARSLHSDRFATLNQRPGPSRRGGRRVEQSHTNGRRLKATPAPPRASKPYAEPGQLKTVGTTDRAAAPTAAPRG